MKYCEVQWVKFNITNLKLDSLSYPLSFFEKKKKDSVRKEKRRGKFK